MMRIITGKARGTQLKAPAGETTRPTSERAKEAIFSMLQFELQGTEVLDLFAGSGQMGLEALSRGAAHAVFCDSSKSAQQIIQSNSLKTKLALQCEIFSNDYLVLLRSFRKKRKFDIVFLDPPYALGALPKALQALVDYGLLSDGAKLICESGAENDVFASDEALRSHFEVLKASHYGIAYVTVLAYRAKAEEEVGNV